ncbi:hypothetical protein COU17_00735 [Candidatus Kaiserbacteria bacterium CG10_big_fil_rev_8_21_14_0_10_49_17]|uniref:Capsule synthesis protein CapA domain-containing protein n=1 Tax=Candidatus Kaiserbacteria bacterium CG10_big_fil_rev_8_21_14_0_10_49_17 TaxID=1974609 RepID=A0A2M6WEZ0_9BACT|nr:MAG: hypothetical protein COU17_00735 [Candidatus Kaiserbacteria bacterium CG10_big_fil_rev_8_21_14_0_10_49_17]
MQTTSSTRASIVPYITVGIFVLCIFAFIKAAETETTSLLCPNGEAPVRITVLGDLLIGSGAPWRQIESEDFAPTILGRFRAAFAQSDITFMNYEGIIASGGVAREKGLPKSFSLRTPPAIEDFLSFFPGLVISFANNHAADFGFIGIDETLTHFTHSNISLVGIGENEKEAIEPRIVRHGGVRVAFLGFTDLLPYTYYAREDQRGIAKLTEENLARSIKQAQEMADIVIVALHTAEHVGGTSTDAPDAHQIRLSQRAVEFGADVVVNSHPHTLQTVEWYNGALIAHSLGLFLYDPSVAGRYKPDESLYAGTRFDGGGILSLSVCVEGIRSYTLTPTRVVDTPRLQVVEDMRQPIRARQFTL